MMDNNLICSSTKTFMGRTVQHRGGGGIGALRLLTDFVPKNPHHNLISCS